VNRNGLPDGAYEDELSDVDLEFEVSVDCVDCVERDAASARSLRHFNSEAAFALDTQITTTNSASALS
jgi:hypothetical protein